MIFLVNMANEFLSKDLSLTDFRIKVIETFENEIYGSNENTIKLTFQIDRVTKDGITENVLEEYTYDKSLEDFQRNNGAIMSIKEFNQDINNFTHMIYVKQLKAKINSLLNLIPIEM